MLETGLTIVGAVLTIVVAYLTDRGLSQRSARIQAEALRDAEAARRVLLEKAAEAERAARAVELNDQTASVRTADDAARLVRERLSRHRPR